MDLDKKKEKILNLIDDSRENGRKIAFYSDPVVANIIEQLYNRWEKNKRIGIPLDYADEKEIKILYNMAIKYSNISDEEAWALFMSREDAYISPSMMIEEREEKKESIWRRVFWFILPR